MQARVVCTSILRGYECCRWIRTELSHRGDGVLGAGGTMKLDRGRCWVEGCVGLIAPFPLCPAFPVEAYAVVTRLALTFTIVTSWPFFSTLDLAVLAGPSGFSASVNGMYELVGLPAAIATTLLGLSTSWLLRSRHGGIRLEMETDRGCGLLQG